AQSAGAHRAPALRLGEARRLAHAQQLDIEDQSSAGRDRSREALVPVSQRRRHEQPARPADLHARDALVPALDHGAAAELERDRLFLVTGAIELLAVGEPARVVHGHGLTGLSDGARALSALDVAEARRQELRGARELRDRVRADEITAG